MGRFIIAMEVMSAESIRQRVKLIEAKRELLVQLLARPDLGTLRIDVNQAIEEMDELIGEFRRTFPDN
jgi:hypothetical protein